jgi:tetratricopeptide (TPR) repeat protein
MRAAAILVLMASLAGCAARAEERDALAGLRLVRDAPLDLADDQDLELERADFAALPDGSPGRAARRRRLADEFARRLDAGLARGERDTAQRGLRSLLSLWSVAELRSPEVVGRELSRYRAVLLRARAIDARAGRDRETAIALGALLLADPQRAAVHRAELDEIFAYVDELALVDEAPEPGPPRSIEILEGIVDVHPAPWVVDRLVALYLEHQARTASRARRSGGEFRLSRGDPAGRTAWHIARALGRAGRIGEAAAIIEAIDGVGDDRELRDRLRRAGSAGAGAADWVLLSARFQSSDPRRGDMSAALAIALEAVRRFPKSAAAHLAAAESARQLGEPALAIRYYESGLALAPTRAAAVAQLGRLYVTRISTLAASDRPAAAGRMLEAFARFHRSATRALGKPIEPDLADAQAALGSALVSLGELGPAKRLLVDSIERRPTLDALEALGSVALKQDHFALARDLFERALQVPADETLSRFQQSRLMRLLADALDGTGERALARVRYRVALVSWHRMMERPILPPSLAAEALVEQGKILWQLGDRRTALAAFDAAVDVDPDGASIHSDVVAFLIVRGEYERALDAYHRALGSRAIGDYFKVYMSLWVTAEALRRSIEPDPIARDYLVAREGTLWFDDLARYATGRLGAEELRARATTRSRRAELLYYTAVLDAENLRHPERARRLLESVVGTDMVMFFEYDMAKHWLARGARGRDGAR